MASSYSTNLALELIGTGDQAGAWGNTTNTNLGTLIEQAISGYVTQAVTTGNTVTLTIPNGATGVARNMYIELTGTGGASTFLEVPANKKLYFIYNNASGAVTVRVSGQTGVSVAAGTKKILVSNGTDIVEATSYITGPTTTPTNGQLLIGNGSGYSLSTLTAGSNITITNSAGSITIASASATGDITFSSATISAGTNQNIRVNPNGSGQLWINTTATAYVSSPMVTILANATSYNVIPLFLKSQSWVRDCLVCWNSNSDDATQNDQLITFGTETTYTFRGSITYNRSAGLVSYGTSSDRRIKTVYGPVTDSGQVIDQLKIYRGKMNSGTFIYPMMIADEAQQVVPYSVSGKPNAVDDKGNPMYQQMDYSSLVPLLIAEIQSLRARVAALEAKP